jgi:class 3 adenylate cyclase
VLAEFASDVNAVRRAAEIQTTLKTGNANLPPERRMEFRIGVSLGDIMVDGEQNTATGPTSTARKRHGFFQCTAISKRLRAKPA